jgi:uncharacterized protein (TIGR02270 family)
MDANPLMNVERPPLAKVVAQHAEEAAFLWVLRDGASRRADHGLTQLARVDDRVDAHLDGLRVAGDAGWSACEEGLAWNEAGEVFAAGYLAFSSGDPERIERVMEIAGAEAGLTRAFASALGWLEADQALPRIRSLLGDGRPLARRLGIAAAAIHRWHPGAELARCMAADDPSVRARAFRAAGELGDKQAVQDLLMGLLDPDESCVFAAAWSGALLGLPASLAVLEGIAGSGSEHSDEAMMLAMRRIDLASCLACHARLAADPGRVRSAIRAAGIIGEVSLVPWLIPLMEQLPLARLAGESFTTITGADLALLDLERERPADHDAGPGDDPAEDDVAMDPDEGLPWPDPVSVRHWWDENRSRFQGGTRHLLGVPITDDGLKIALREGRQPQRAAAALEIALRDPGQPLFNVKAPGFRQKRLLG